MEQKFTKHLIENGIIDKKTENQILSLYREKCIKYNSDKIKFNELMTEVLLYIIYNLSEIQKKYICFHLPVKFLKISYKIIQEKLKNIINKKILKNKLVLSKYIFKWYKYINKNIFEKNKNIFRKKCNNNKITIITNSNINGRNNYRNESIRDSLFNNKSIINKCHRNFSTINNENKLKTNQNSNDKINFPKNLKFLENENVRKYTNLNKIIHNNECKIKNKKLFQITGNISSKKNSNTNDISLTSDMKDTIESNNNYLNYNKNIENNRYNNNQDNKNKSLSYSEYTQNCSSINVYNIKLKNKISKDSSSFKYNKTLKNKILLNKSNNTFKNKSNNNHNLIKNESNENLVNNKPHSPEEKNIDKNNIYNSIYCNNYKNLNHNNIFNEYNKFKINIVETPFCESITRSKSTKQYSACNRLFDDSKKKMRKIKEKQMEQEKYLNTLACGISGKKKFVDYGRINSLYKSKEISNIYEKTKNKVEKEEGLTFKPKINESEYNKRIFANFIVRNTSHSKNKSINEYNNSNNNSNNKLLRYKKIGKKQKEKIVKAMIDRLYNNSLCKSMSSCCNKYTRGISQKKCYKKKL